MTPANDQESASSSPRDADKTGMGPLERQCEHILSFIQSCVEIHTPGSGAQKALEDAADGIRAAFLQCAREADKQ